MATLRSRVYALVEVPPEKGARLDWFDMSIAVLIIVSVTIAILATVEWIELSVGTWLFRIEFVSCCIFAVEYLLRVWTCVENARYSHPVIGRVRFAISPLAIIDLLSFLPTLLPFMSANLVVLRVARLLRIARILKLGRYSRALSTLGRVLASRAAELAVMGVVTLLVLLVAATFMYYIEHEAQPQVFSSIPASMWWAIITLTTIGYGDAYPITTLGRIVGGIVALSGIGVVALPTAIIAQAFAEELRASRSTVICPHCGKAIHSAP